VSEIELERESVSYPVLGRRILLVCLERMEFRDLTGDGVLFQRTASLFGIQSGV